MKKIYFILAFALMLFGGSCRDYLSIDSYINDMVDIESVFTKKNLTEQWLWNTYGYLKGKGAEIVNKSESAFSWASDECVYGDRLDQNPCRFYQNGEYSPEKMLWEDRWGHLYVGIRRASTFIVNVDKCSEMSANEREDSKAQARFLRAYFYWMLIKQFGPVPILPEDGLDVSLQYEELAQSRNSFDECVDYITSEFALAAQVLPTVRSAAWLGMPTRGSALAARAKVYLYAASPLYNGNQDLSNLRDDKGRELINSNYSEVKWARAAAAAKEVIDLNIYRLLVLPATINTPPIPDGVPNAMFPNGCGGIDPFESYRQCFNGEVSAFMNPELIFTRQGDYTSADIIDIVKHAMPITIEGWNTVAATMKQVDAYYMCDGKSIDNSSARYPYRLDGFTQSATEYPYLPQDVSLMNANREPRYYASIAFNGSIWENETTTETSKRRQQYFYYKGTPNGKELSKPGFYIRTGYGVKKYYNPDDSWNVGGSRKSRVEPTIRFADVLLWYAEALNELKGSHSVLAFSGWGNIEVSRDISIIRKAFSLIRFRAGLPDASDAEYANADQFRRVLKRERQIEFFIEASRYFDLRRWKDAEQEEDKPLMGLNIDMENTDSQRQMFYKTKEIGIPKIFIKKMYFWPIPYNEIRRNSKLTQNPGW